MIIIIIYGGKVAREGAESTRLREQLEAQSGQATFYS